MALPARPPTMTRRRWLLAGLTVPVFRVSASVSLNASWDGDVIHVAVPELHFIAGKPLERLRNGLSVVYLSQLSLLTDDRATVFRRAPDRLVVSYDLWEEKFSV